MSSLTLVVCKQKRRKTTHSTRIHLLVLLGRYQRAYQSLAADSCCGPIRTVDQQHLFSRVAQKTHETKSCVRCERWRGAAQGWSPGSRLIYFPPAATNRRGRCRRPAAQRVEWQAQPTAVQHSSAPGAPCRLHRTTRCCLAWRAKATARSWQRCGAGRESVAMGNRGWAGARGQRGNECGILATFEQMRQWRSC
jgi:hypothetical protein